MSISQKDIKLLWGRAASRCAFPECRIPLTQNSKSNTKSETIGEQAHIVAKQNDGPRGDSSLSDQERDSYSNLILLCPNHHAEIDSKPEDFPVEKLYIIKSKHELWVEESLSQESETEEDRSLQVYKHIVDLTVNLCHLENWTGWTSLVLSPTPSWPKNIANDIDEFRRKVLKFDFPESFDELRCSITTLSITLDNSLMIFRKHYEEKNGMLHADAFYKIPEWNPERYYTLANEFEDWVDTCHDSIIHATKAANWFRDTVRREVDSSFLSSSGKFSVLQSSIMDEDGEIYDHEFVPTYTTEEKASLPDSLV